MEGYLQGQGQILPGDRLVALQPVKPITTTEGYRYTLYNTSAAPVLGGLDAYTITKPGLQTLTVSSQHPLLLFDLDVSLEWDARNDGSFLEDLGQALQQSSEVLYEVTNGQAALGDVRIYPGEGALGHG